MHKPFLWHIFLHLESMQIFGVFRTKSNIYDGAFFCKNSYFSKKALSKMFDWVLNMPLTFQQVFKLKSKAMGRKICVFLFYKVKSCFITSKVFLVYQDFQVANSQSMYCNRIL